MGRLCGLQNRAVTARRNGLEETLSDLSPLVYYFFPPLLGKSLDIAIGVPDRPVDIFIERKDLKVS